MNKAKSLPVALKRTEAVIQAVFNLHAKTKTSLIHEGLFKDLREVSDLLQQDYAPNEIATILNDPRILPLKGSFSQVVSQLETRLEIAQCAEYVADSQTALHKLNDFVFLQKYQSLVEKEWALYERLPTLSPLTARFAFVGCGAMPLTAIGMARNYNVPVDCFDVNPDAVQLAKVLVKELGLEDKVTCQHVNGLDINYAPYDIVIVANLAQPQGDILKRISTHQNVKAVIVRIVEDLVTLLYPSINLEKVHEVGWKVATRVTPGDKRSVHQSVLLVPSLA